MEGNTYLPLSSTMSRILSITSSWMPRNSSHSDVRTYAKTSKSREFRAEAGEPHSHRRRIDARMLGQHRSYPVHQETKLIRVQVVTNSDHGLDQHAIALREVHECHLGLYHRFSPSFRYVENLLAQRGIEMSNETIRHWCLKFSPEWAAAFVTATSPALKRDARVPPSASRLGETPPSRSVDFAGRAWPTRWERDALELPPKPRPAAPSASRCRPAGHLRLPQRKAVRFATA